MSCSLVKNVRSYQKTLVFTQADLQERLEKKFPLKKKVSIKKHEVMTFVLSNPQVVLQEETNRIGLHLDSNCELPEIGFKEAVFLHIRLGVPGTMFFTGELDYRPKKGEFYFERLQLHELETPGLPAKYEEDLKKVLSAAIGAYLNAVPIYTLEDKGLKEDIGRLILRSIVVKNGELIVVLGLPE